MKREREGRCATECSVEERYTRQTNMPADTSDEGDKLRDRKEEGRGNMRRTGRQTGRESERRGGGG